MQPIPGDAQPCKNSGWDDPAQRRGEQINVGLPREGAPEPSPIIALVLSARCAQRSPVGCVCGCIWLEELRKGVSRIPGVRFSGETLNSRRVREARIARPGRLADHRPAGLIKRLFREMVD
jgi:hypothetical protein